MSKYTIELRYIIENEKLFPQIEDSLSLTNILKNYQLLNENFKDPTRKDNKTRREELNDKILNHYYFREIGVETTPRFLFLLKRKLDEIMPLYNQMYKSIDLDVDILANTDLTETFTHTVEGNGTTSSSGESLNSGTNTNSSDSINVEQDTPPTELSDEDIKGNKFASRTSHNKNTSSEMLGTKVNSNGETISTDIRTETYTRTEKGSSKGGGTYAQNIEQWRNVMINIDMLIIDELEPLFMQIW